MPQLLTADQVEFWRSPEKAGWMQSQGEHIKTWRRRWFVLKQVGHHAHRGAAVRDGLLVRSGSSW